VLRDSGQDADRVVGGWDGIRTEQLGSPRVRTQRQRYGPAATGGAGGCGPGAFHPCKGGEARRAATSQQLPLPVPASPVVVGPRGRASPDVGPACSMPLAFLRSCGRRRRGPSASAVVVSSVPNARPAGIKARAVHRIPCRPAAAAGASTQRLLAMGRRISTSLVLVRIGGWPGALKSFFLAVPTWYEISNATACCSLALPD
jgi:hypothetical protein